LDVLRAALRAEAWAEIDVQVVDSGACYGDGDAAEVSIRKRGRRYDLNDRGAATTKAGKPRGWFEVAQRLVAQEGFNVNRAGVISVHVVEGRDLASVALRLADISLAVYAKLLELEGP
jgi:hypothetical protein